MNYQQDDWTDWLAAAEFSYNDKKHAATGKIPFELNFGRHPWKEDLMVQNRDTTGRRIHETPAEELGTYYTCNGRVSEKT